MAPRLNDNKEFESLFTIDINRNLHKATTRIGRDR